jgi:hypothetical protein
MGTTVNLNGTSYTIPAVGEGNWGNPVSQYLIALSTGVLTKAGGSFTLTADVDFGTNYGLKSLFFSSRNTPSTVGTARLGNNESIGWRNAANNANKELKVNASNVLEFDGNPLVTLALGAASTVLRMNAGGTAYEFAKIENVNVDNAAAINFSKLESLSAGNILLGNASNVPTSTVMAGDVTINSAGTTDITAGVIIDADISGSAGIVYSKLNLSLGIVNGDISASAAIGLSKLAALTADRILSSNGSGVITALDTATYPSLTELSYVKGVTSGLQTQLGTKANLSGATFTGNVIIDNEQNVRFRESTGSGSNYIGFKAPTSLGGDTNFVLPTGDGGANQVLKTDGSANLGWATVAAGIGTNFDINIVSSANYTILDTDGFRHIQVSTGASDRTITLPTAADNSDRMITISKTDSGVGDVIIDGEGAETIDGATTYTLDTQYQQLTIVCNGTSWSKVSGQIATASEFGLVKGGKVPGDTSGVAISAGMVGEVIQSLGGVATNQTGGVNDTILFTTAGAPALVLTAGTWLIHGHTAMINTVTTDESWLRLYESGGATVFGGGTLAPTNTTTRVPFSCSGTLSFTGANRTIYLIGNRNGGSTLNMGSVVNAPCGYLIATRIG